MCGIIGAYWSKPPSNSISLFEEGLQTLLHRGPDDTDSCILDVGTGMLALGHTRLSIIDLSSAGRQPMHSPDNRYSIIYNGEIYNFIEIRDSLRQIGHKFQTQTDTEVLLAAWSQWGESCLGKIEGMFAFAILDKHRMTISCVRDAFGVKPFYYLIANDRFLFGSEISTVVALNQKRNLLNNQVAYDYLVCGEYDKGDSTFFEGINRLKPGHILTVKIRDPISLGHVDRWWKPSIIENSNLSFMQAADELREFFLQSIRMNLRSDVPVGATLSGGIDSSSIVCAVRHLEPDLPIHTFSFVAENDDLNEEHWIDIINEHAGATSHKIKVSSSDLLSDLYALVQSQGEPFGSTSIYAQYRVFKEAKDRGITVTLDGQGADELLAGYNGYASSRVRSLLDQRRYISIYKFISSWSKWPNRSKRQGALSIASAITPNRLRPSLLRFIGVNKEPDWLIPNILGSINKTQSQPDEAFGIDAHGRHLSVALLSALSGNGLDALLRHGDRNSMHWSVESRVPFLSAKLAEYTLSLPEEYLVSSEGSTKHVFKQAMRGIVPAKILDRRDKIGFQTPECKWLKEIEPCVYEWIDSSGLGHLIDKPKAIAHLSNVFAGNEPFGQDVWRLINLCCWSQIFGVNS